MVFGGYEEWVRLMEVSMVWEDKLKVVSMLMGMMGMLGMRFD